MAEGGGLFGGLATGIGQGLEMYQAKAKADRQAAKDKVEESRAQQGLALQGLRLKRQEAADKALQTYRDSQLGFEKRKVEIQEKQFDLTLTGKFTEILSNQHLHPQAREFLLDQTIQTVGGDPKSERYKQLKKVMLTMPVDQAKALSSAMVTALPNLPPGSVKQMVEGLLAGNVDPGQIPEILSKASTAQGRAEAFAPTGAAAPQPGQPPVEGQGVAPDPNAPPIPQIGANPPAPPPAPVGQPPAGEPPAGAAPTDKPDDMNPDALRMKARKLGAAGDLEGAKTMMQMARDMEAPPPRFEQTESIEGTKLDYKMAEEAMKGAEAARTSNANLEAFNVGLEGGRFTTGVLGGQREVLSQIGEFVGVNPESGIMKMLLGTGDPASASAMDAASKRLALGMADRMSRMTNMSLGFLNESVPNLTRTPDGNKLIAQMIQAANNRTIEAADLLEEYRTQYGTLRPKGRRSYFQEAARMAEKPLFDDAFVKKVKEESRKGAGVDLGAAFEMIGQEAEGKLTLGDGKTYEVKGMAHGLPTVETQRGKFPVVRTTEELDKILAMPGEITVIWGPTGREFVKRARK